MPRKQTGRGINGSGSIRKVTRKSNGKTYTYWQARYTTGRDPGTGKQIQKNICGQSQADVALKLREATCNIDQGTYIPPTRQTVSEWLNQWADTYTLNLKPRTRKIYESDIRLHINPYIGAVRLDELTTPLIQSMYADLMKSSKRHPKAISPKSVKNVHGVLRKALDQAVKIGYIRINPAEGCVLPRVEKPKIKPLNDAEISDFLTVIKGNRFEWLFIITLFTGMREGEVLGLTWDCVDFEYATVTIEKQLQLHQEKGIKAYELVPTKTDKVRSMALGEILLRIFKQQKREQSINRLRLGGDWENHMNLVFTDGLGKPLKKSTVYREFKRAAAAIGRPDARFHDLRHSFAVASIRAGDDIKTLSGNLGHSTTTFTLDVYGHVTMDMKKESAAKMDAFIKTVSDL